MYLAWCTALLHLPICRTSKVKDGRDHWRVVYIAIGYSDGRGVEFGTYPQQPHAKHEQWFIKPEPGKICGLNG
jgi:hypothetical protein